MKPLIPAGIPKKKILVIIFSLFIIFSKAQDTTVNAVKDSGNTTAVRIPATFAEGSEAWKNFIYGRLHSDIVLQNGAPPGLYVVTVSFLIDTTGKVTEVKVLEDPGYGTARDVLNAFKHAPDWIPATIDGKKVKYRQKQNFTYQVGQ